VQRLSTRLGFGGALGLSLLTYASPGEAADAQRFSWSWVRLSGAETCAAADDIAGNVRARLGRDPFATPAERHIEGWAEHSGEHWFAQLNVTGPDGSLIGSRQLESSEATCATLIEAVTLAVVLMIDPQASLAPQPASQPEIAPAKAPAPPVAMPPALPVPAEKNREPAPRAVQEGERGLAMTAALRALAVWGVLPRTSVGVESGAELELSRVVGVTAAVGFLPTMKTANKHFGFGLLEASLGPCFTLARAPRTRLALCAEAQLGAIQAAAYHVEPLPSTDHFWFAVRAGLRLRQPLFGPVGLELGAQALVPVIRHDFALTGVTEPVYQARALGFWGSAGLTASIP
jgi:hypothetical protein